MKNSLTIIVYVLIVIFAILSIRVYRNCNELSVTLKRANNLIITLDSLYENKTDTNNLMYYMEQKMPKK